jgi:hypothetical protein
MRAIRTTTISILALGLLAGSAVGVAAQDEEAAGPVSGPLPAGTGPLAPGTYTDSALGHTLTLTVGDGWSIGGESLEGVGVDLVPEPFTYDGPEGMGFVGITRTDGAVFDPPCVPAGGDPGVFQEEAATSIEPTAAALAEHLASNPYLETTEPAEIEVAGYGGVQLDAVANVGPECEFPATFLWANAMWRLSDGYQARYHFIDVGGEVVAIVLEASPDVDLDELAAAAAPVIDSMSIEPAE